MQRTGPVTALRLDGNALPVCQPRGAADRIREVVTGLIATDELPNLQRLGDYVQEAFTELEASVRDAHAP